VYEITANNLDSLITFFGMDAARVLGLELNPKVGVGAGIGIVKI